MTDALRAALTSLLPRLRRFAASLTGSSDDGDALVRAACEYALGNGDDWRLGTRLDAWLYAIMRSRWGAQPPQPAVHAAGRDARGSGEPTLDAVRALLAALPADERTVLLLVCAEGFTYRETAEALGIPIGTVAARLARARLALLPGQAVEVDQ